MAEDGLRIGKNTTLEATLPGFTTVTQTVPAFATSEALIVAFRRWLEILSVSRGDPFHSTTAPERNPVPFTIRVNPLLPGLALGGSSGWLMDCASRAALAKAMKQQASGMSFILLLLDFVMDIPRVYIDFANQVHFPAPES